MTTNRSASLGSMSWVRSPEHRRGRVLIVSVIAVVLALCSAAPASAAPADGYAYISIHFHAEGGGRDLDCAQNHRFGDNGSSCSISTGVFTAGHTPPFDNRGYANMRYSPTTNGRTFVEFYLLKSAPYTSDGKEALIEGTIPSRGSGAYTISAWDVHNIGWAAGGQIAGAQPGQIGGPLKLNVKVISGILGDAGYDMYLDGYVYNGRYGSGLPSTGSFDGLFAAAGVRPD